MALTPPAIPPPGAHGGDAPTVARALGLDPTELLDLSQTMNPFGPRVADLVRRHADAVGHYPDAMEGTGMLARTLGVEADHVLLTNGGSEAIHLVTAELGGRVRSEPEFGLHPRGTTGPVWRTDPHSPSGRLALPDERVDVWDEAFYPLATGRWTAGRHPAVVVGSLTKTFDCPGLRLGYVLADPELVRRVTTRQPRWSVGSLALAVLPDLLQVADPVAWCHQIALARAELIRVLTGHGLHVDAADAPWVLVHGTDLRTRLAPSGVLVRDCASFGLPGTSRIAVPDADGLARLDAALAATG